jgi:type IV secretory pathway VirJ component
MKRRNRILLVIAGSCLLASALIFNPWARVSLEQATVVLPVTDATVLAPVGRRDVLTIIYSGDGGWSDLDKELGNAFVASGVPVLGVSTFQYFWRDRKPQQAAEQLDALITQYAARWGKQRLWLVGFSFGANVLPTIIDKLAPANRARITQLVLLSPGRRFNFEIEIEGYMSRQGWWKEHIKTWLALLNPVADHDALPPIQALHQRPPVVCYYGTDDRDESLCTEPGLPAWVTVHARNGGHHFDEGYQRLARQMLAELPVSASRSGAVQ